MRAYFFCNFYLSSIQQGIQSAHCMHTMFTKYDNKAETIDPEIGYDEHTMLYDWAENHKTMIVLNGGDSQSLADLYGQLVPFAREMYLPIAKFSEDERSLNNALTSVGIVLPESVYAHDLENELNTIKFGIAADVGEMPLSTTGQLKQLISRYRLAN